MVKCVILTTDGVAKETTMNLSARAAGGLGKMDELTEYLGFSKTFVGQYDEDPRQSSVVLITTRHTDEKAKTPKCIGLPAPFQDEAVCNDVVFIRMETSEENVTSPTDFSIHDFEKLKIDHENPTRPSTQSHREVPSSERVEEEYIHHGPSE